jgi:hypothetical protein
MTVFGSSGFHQGPATGTTTSTLLIASVPANAYVSKIDVQGYINLKIANVTFTAGNIPGYNLSAGIQYGPQGYGGHSITDGSAGGANWISFANVIPATLANQNIPGASPQTFTQGIGYPAEVHLRPNFYAKVATDLYFCIGINNTLSYVPSYQIGTTFNVEWATYP